MITKCKEYGKLEKKLERKGFEIDDLKLKLADRRIKHKKETQKLKQSLNTALHEKRQAEFGVEDLKLKMNSSKDENLKLKQENGELSRLNERHSKGILHEMIENLNGQLEKCNLKLKEKESETESGKLEIGQMKQCFQVLSEKTKDLEFQNRQTLHDLNSARHENNNLKHYLDNMRTQNHVQMEQKKCLQSQNQQLHEQLKNMINNPQIQNMQLQNHKLTAEMAQIHRQLNSTLEQSQKLNRRCSQLQAENDALSSGPQAQRELNEQLSQRIEDQASTILNLQALLKKNLPRKYEDRGTQTMNIENHGYCPLHGGDLSNCLQTLEDLMAINHFIQVKIKNLPLNENFLTIPFQIDSPNSFLKALTSKELEEMQTRLTRIMEETRGIREEMTEQFASEAIGNEACLTQ